MRTSSNRVVSTLLLLTLIGAGSLAAEATRKFQIHPSIGIARVGDSLEYYLAPDSWGRHFVPPEGYRDPGTVVAPPGYRDSQRKVRRMGVRFRIYEVDDDGNVIGEEIKASANTQIAWTVHLVNKKAAKLKPDSDQRLNQDDPATLEIDTDAQTIGPVHPAAKRNVGGNIGPAGTFVKLGDLFTNGDGQLIVVGGHGDAGSWNGSPLSSHGLDNRDWYDDTSDGPVNATIAIDGTSYVARSAWVVVAPPDYARPIMNLVTLYDLVGDRSAEEGTEIFEITDQSLEALEDILPAAVWQDLEPRLTPIRDEEIQGQEHFENAIGGALPAQYESLILKYAEQPVSFIRDVYPILRRVPHLQWTLIKQRAVEFGRTAMHAHGMEESHPALGQLLEGAHDMHRTKADFFEPTVFSMLHLNDLGNLSMFLEAQRLRNHVLDRLKDPRPGGCTSGGIGEPHSMPPIEELTLTPTQYKILLRWRDGFFVDDWDDPNNVGPAWVDPPELTFDPANPTDQPAALDRAAMKGAVGGPLTPGVDVGPRMADSATYDEPFHINSDVVEAGDVTQDLSVPWQAGFNQQVGLYPAARPVNVIVRSGPNYAAQLWTRPHTTVVPITAPGFAVDATAMDIAQVVMDYDTIYQNQRMDHNMDMVRDWSTLGFLAQETTATGELMYIETQRK